MDNIRSSSRMTSPARGACYLCAAHGVHAVQRTHVCPFSTCDCSSCNIIRVRRAVVARQMRMRRDEMKSENSPSLLYTCNRCRNHGLSVPKKGHKNACPYYSCNCPLCALCHSRSILDASFRRNIQRGERRRVSKSSSPTPMSSSIDSLTRRPHSALAAPLIESPSSSPDTSSPAMSNVHTPTISGSVPFAPMIPASFSLNPMAEGFSGALSIHNSFLAIPSALPTFIESLLPSFPDSFLFGPAISHNPVHYTNSYPIADENMLCPSQFASEIRVLVAKMKDLIGYDDSSQQF